MHPFPPPQIAANELRPGRYWYVIAAAIAVVLIVLGVALGVYRLDKALGAVDTGHQFANGDTVTVRLDQDGEKAIWTKDPGPGDGRECAISGPGHPRLTDSGADVTLTSGDTWHLLYTAKVSQTGDYAVTCSSMAPSRYAFGNSLHMTALTIGLVLAIALPVLGIGICVAIVLITALRRSSHRKRLLAERYGYGGRPPVHPGLVPYRPGP
ncbi:hypothetical protein G3I40_36465 [Streptomyces sp. SID14478]|uniref:hypothetical protein n=1 Tax=Streptomyces sp. SID14478 TaxID=2706073 RepID=UPI0013DF87D2|nr:hypothetical protein [Streptomyces sp. SID14478]NEB80664.1 hypothetical protein [Streptomyces sp. SID14478]